MGSGCSGRWGGYTSCGEVVGGVVSEGNYGPQLQPERLVTRASLIRTGSTLSYPRRYWDKLLPLLCGRRRTNYFCRKMCWRISGQNSLKKLLSAAASSCVAQFTVVLLKLRSSAG